MRYKKHLLPKENENKLHENKGLGNEFNPVGLILRLFLQIPWNYESSWL